MECTFQVGQKVVCVCGHKDLNEGSVYAITKIYRGDGGSIFVSVSGAGQPGGWYPDRFRPLTDISQFRQIVADVKAGKRVEFNDKVPA